MSSFLEVLRRKVLVIDGAMGTSIHAHHLDLERDFGGLENCCEIVSERRPDVIRAIHAAFLRVGSGGVTEHMASGVCQRRRGS